ncbi:MAG: hypothetical protein AAGJ46_01940 [Planctomycetota bacterium]
MHTRILRLAAVAVAAVGLSVAPSAAFAADGTEVGNGCCLSDGTEVGNGLALADGTEVGNG